MPQRTDPLTYQPSFPAGYDNRPAPIDPVALNHFEAAYQRFIASLCAECGEALDEHYEGECP